MLRTGVVDGIVVLFCAMYETLFDDFVLEKTNYIPS